VTKSDTEREKGGSHDPQVPDDYCQAIALTVFSNVFNRINNTAIEFPAVV
jgi:hypothetical protein